MKKTICFDLWKTLAYEPCSLDDYWQPLLEKYPNQVSKGRLKKLIDQIPMKKPLSIEKGIKKILNVLNIEDKNLANEISKRWKYSCKSSSLFDDVIPTLKELKNKGYKLVLITNTSKYGWQKINKKYKLEKYFSITAKSFELGFVKPESEMFAFIESQIDTEKQNIFMVGDSLKSDIIPTKSRGWQAIPICRDNYKDKLEKNEIIIKNISDLKNYL